MTVAVAQGYIIQYELTPTLNTSPQVTFALRDLASTVSLVAVESCESTQMNAGVAPAKQYPCLQVIRNTTMHKQGFSIRHHQNKDRDVTTILEAGGQSGAMYGLMRISELLRHAGARRSTMDWLTVVPTVEVREPKFELRGLKMNVPLDARTPSYGDGGDSAQHNIATMWNLSFWHDHLDQMARYKYNLLTLWSLDPWPSIVQYKGEYADMSLSDVTRSTINWTDFQGNDKDLVTEDVLAHLEVLKKMTIQEKIQFWQDVIQYASDRGISVMIVTWNVFVYPILNNQTVHDVNISQANPATVAWVRESVRLTMATYGKLAGIGTDPGERMVSKAGNYTREEWVWETYGQGLLDSSTEDRSPLLLIRLNQANLTRVLELFEPLLKTNVTFMVGVKYAHNAHMFGSTHPPYARESVIPNLPAGVKALWCLRNDDIFNFRWGNPAYTKEYLANMPNSSVSAGFHIGADGYVFARTWAQKSGQQLEIEKHWYNFMQWGQLGYDSSLDVSFFVDALAARFPEVKQAQLLFDTWKAASSVVPTVNVMVVGSWVNDFQFMPEGCFSRTGFNSIIDFIKAEPVPENGLVSIADYVQLNLTHKVPSNLTTPFASVAILEMSAQSTLTGVAAIRQDGTVGTELNATLTDLESFAFLGRYYACKILGATYHEFNQKTSESNYKVLAVDALTKAESYWLQYVQSAQVLYNYPQLLGRVGNLDFDTLTEGVRTDMKLAQ